MEEEDSGSDIEIKPQLTDTASAPPPHSYGSPAPAPDDDKLKRRISVGRFRAIMEQADKKYNVDDIVMELADEDDFIPLTSIRGFTKRMETITCEAELDKEITKMKMND